MMELYHILLFAKCIVAYYLLMRYSLPDNFDQIFATISLCAIYFLLYYLISRLPKKSIGYDFCADYIQDSFLFAIPITIFCVILTLTTIQLAIIIGGGLASIILPMFLLAIIG